MAAVRDALRDALRPFTHTDTVSETSNGGATAPRHGAAMEGVATASDTDATAPRDVPAHVQFLHDISVRRVTQRNHILALAQSALVLHGVTQRDAFPDRRVQRKLYDACIQHSVNVQEMQHAWQATSHADARVQLLACPAARFNAALHVALHTRALHTPHGALIGATCAGVRRQDVLDALVCPQDVCRLACIAHPSVLDAGAPLDGHNILPAARTFTGERVRYVLHATLFPHQQRVRPSRRPPRGVETAAHSGVHVVQQCMYVDDPPETSAVGKVHAALRGTDDGAPAVARPRNPRAPTPPSAQDPVDAALRQMTQNTSHAGTRDATSPVPAHPCSEAFHPAQAAVLHATRARCARSKRAHAVAARCGEALRDAGVRPRAHDVATLLGIQPERDEA